MDRQEEQDKLKRLSKEIKSELGDLTENEIKRSQGNREYLLGKLQEKYGWTREQAEAQVSKLFGRG